MPRFWDVIIDALRSALDLKVPLFFPRGCLATIKDVRISFQITPYDFSTRTRHIKYIKRFNLYTYFKKIDTSSL